MCEYLIPSLRSKDWKADPTIQAKIDEQMKKAHFRKIVANLQKKVKDQESSSSSNSSNEAEISPNAAYTAGFAGHNAPYSLHDSFILDSGATVHICNNRQRFEDFVPASDQLYAGESRSDIEGYGTVRINLTRPSGKINIKLAHVAYIPEFQTNTVSYRRLLEKGIHWDTQNGILTFEGRLWCQLTDIGEQFVVEYQPVAAFSADSQAPRPNSHSTVERRHQRMGHLHEGAVKKPPQVSTGRLTPSTDSSLSRLTTPVFEPLTNLESINTVTQSQQAPQASRPLAPRDINSDIRESNIISGPRQRRMRQDAHYAALEQPDEKPGFHAAFAAGHIYNRQQKVEQSPIPKTLQHQLPPPPKSWKEMLRHPHSQSFQAAAEKEFRALEQRGAFKPTSRPPKKYGKARKISYKCLGWSISRRNSRTRPFLGG